MWSVLIGSKQSIYASSSPLLSPLGLQIKEGSLWTKQLLWQSFGHLQRIKPFCALRFDKTGTAWWWGRPLCLHVRKSISCTCVLWYAIKKQTKQSSSRQWRPHGDLVISINDNSSLHVKDIYIHNESMCCQRWCDNFFEWGVAMGIWLTTSLPALPVAAAQHSWKLFHAPFVCQPAITYHYQMSAKTQWDSGV